MQCTALKAAFCYVSMSKVRALQLVLVLAGGLFTDLAPAIFSLLLYGTALSVHAQLKIQYIGFNIWFTPCCC